MFKEYLSVKRIKARPMLLGDYNHHRGWQIPDNESPTTPGYHIVYPDGYQSWCPKQQFEEANQRIDDLTFGHAVEALYRGSRVARRGWNGKNMWLMLCTPDSDYTLESDGKTYGRLPYIYMKTADDMLVPWLASQTDVLSHDWVIIE